VAEFVLSYPFSIDPVNRRANVVNTDTDTYKAQQIKAFLRTSSGERPVFESFGIEEPTFHTFDSGRFYDDFIDFYPPESIKIDKINFVQSNGALSSVIIEFV